MPENKLKKIFSSRAALFLALLAFIWLSLVLVKAFYKKNQLDREIGALKQEIEKLDSQGQELNQLLAYFNSESYLEKEAKDKLNLKKEGESVVMVQGALSAETVPADGAQAPAAAPAATENNLIRWWNFFFKR